MDCTEVLIFLITGSCLICSITCVTGDERTGGKCLSHAQYVCARELTELIKADLSRKQSDICQHFGTFHSCMLQTMETCDYGSGEKVLYESDIVQVYTKQPYSCALIGGNLTFRGVYRGHALQPSLLNFIIWSLLAAWLTLFYLDYLPL